MKKESPLFSILIASFNNGQYLEEALSSIFKQTYSNWEIIIVDDCSTDNSHQTYKKFALDNRIKVLYNESNKGCGYTKYRCIAEAKGDICGYLDPDDALTVDAIEVMVKAHKKRPNYSIVYSTHYLCDSVLNPSDVAKYVGRIPFHETQLTYRGPKISHFCTFKKSFYVKTSGISKKLRKAVDQDLYFKLEEQGLTFYIDQPLYYYRKHEDGISQGKSISKARLYHLVAIFETYKRRLRSQVANITYAEYLNYRIEYFMLRKLYSKSLVCKTFCFFNIITLRINLNIRKG